MSITNEQFERAKSIEKAISELKSDIGYIEATRYINFRSGNSTIPIHSEDDRKIFDILKRIVICDKSDKLQELEKEYNDIIKE